MELEQNTPETLEIPPEMEEEDKAPVSKMPELTGSAAETVNLAEIIPEEDLKKIGERVCRDFDRDWTDGKNRRLRIANILRLFLGDLPEEVDGGGADRLAKARIHYAIVSKAVVRTHARIYDQEFPSNGEFFGVKPTDAEDLDRAIRVAKHLNWQILHQIPEYVPNHDALIMQWLLYGSAFSYMYWDPVKNRPCHEVCRSEDIVLPYKRSSTDPSLSDMPRITRVIRKYRHELEDMEAGDYYIGVEKLFAELEDDDQGTGARADQTSETKQVIQEVIDRDSGVKKGDNDPDAPRELLEQHRWLRLPGDKKNKPVIVTVDKQTKKVLCLKLREDEDPEDRARYNRERDANRAMYEAAMMQWKADMMQYEAGVAQSMTIPPMQGETTSTVPMANPMLPAPPIEPAPPMEPEPVKMVPIHFFTHFVCWPNPEGVYGFGIGSMLEGNNMAADTMASQIIDAATLANTKGGLISRQLKTTRGDLEFRPGLYQEVEAMGQDISKGIHDFDFGGPDPTMGQLVKDQKEEAEELSGAGDILSGEVGGSNETATTTQIRISQAMAAIAILDKRYRRSRTCEGQKLARMNSVHLDDEEYFTVIDPYKNVPGKNQIPGMAPPIMGGPGQAPPPISPPAAPAPPPGPPPFPQSPPQPSIEKVQVGRMDYLEDTDITITADPRMASQPQRFQEAQTIMNVVNSNPFLQALPPVVIAAAHLLFKSIDNTEMTQALAQGLATGPMMGPPQQGGAPPGKPGGGGPPQPENPGPSVPNAGPQPANGVAPAGQVA